MSYEQQTAGMIRSGLVLPAIVIAVCVLSNILLFRRLFMRVNERKPLREIWLGAALSLLVSLTLMLPMLQTLCYTAFLPGELGSQPLFGSGTVEGNEPFLYAARYHAPGSDKISRAGCIVIDEKKYFCLGSDELACGDQISFRYYPKSRVIVSFHLDEVTGEGDRQASGNRYAKLSEKEPILFTVIFLASAACGFLLAVGAAGKALPKNASWISGQMFYRNGLELSFLTAILTGLAVLLIPALRNVPFIVLLIPLLLVQLIRDIPLNYALTEKTLSVYLLRSIRIRSIPIDAVQGFFLFKTEEGSLFILDLSGHELLSCKTLFDFLRYCRKNRKRVLFLPLAESLTDYACAEFFDRFGRPQTKSGLLSTFPLR